jgi:hypothetical protein
MDDRTRSTTFVTECLSRIGNPRTRSLPGEGSHDGRFERREESFSTLFPKTDQDLEDCPITLSLMNLQYVIYATERCTRLEVTQNLVEEMVHDDRPPTLVRVDRVH